MSSLHDILARYEPLGMHKAGELLLRPNDALHLLCELEAANVLVLGVDTWKVVPGGIMETLQSLVVDGAHDAHVAAEHARSFICDIVPTLGIGYVSFVLEELQ